MTDIRIPPTQRIVQATSANTENVFYPSGRIVLLSYGKPVAVKVADSQAFKTRKRWSRTTTKHINEFLEGVFDVQEADQEDIEEMSK
jgi:hypothetical protein